MKKLLYLIIAILSLNAIADPLYIPRSSELHNYEALLNEGQLVYVPNDDGTVQLYVGNGTVEPSPVMDPAVLRGTSSRLIADSQVLIEKSSEIGYEDGYYYIDNKNPLDPQNPNANNKITGTMTISIENYVIHKITYNTSFTDYAGRMGNTGDPQINVSYEKSKAIITWTQIEQSKGKLFNIKVYYIPSYMQYINDLTKIDYNVIDSLGSTTLSKFREFCIKYWESRNELGHDWHRYPALSHIRLNNLGLIYDSTNSVPVFRTQYDVGTSNLVTYGKYFPLMTMVARGGESTASGSLAFTDIKVDTPVTGQVTLKFQQSITGFNIDNLNVVASDYLESNRVSWQPLTPISKTINGANGTIVASSSSTSGRKFYKLVYEGIESGVYQVIFRGNVIIYDGIILRSSTGNTFWKLKVDDSGNITTEQATQNMPHF